MILRHLQLHHFLSYREAHFEFGDAAVVLITGDRGAGKSALLEAIAWGLWGNSSRGENNDLCYWEAEWMQVTLQFQWSDRQFQVQRRFDRRTGLTLQIQQRSPSEESWVDCSQPTTTATQAQLSQMVGLDYIGFCQTIYWTPEHPLAWVRGSSRDRYRQVFQLLQLGSFSRLAAAAHDRDRLLEAEQQWLEQQWQRLQAEVAEHQQLSQIQERQVVIAQQLQQLEQQRSRVEQRQQSQEAIAQTQALLAENRSQQARWQATLARAQTIRAEWQQWQHWQQQATRRAQQTEAQQALQAQIQQLQAQYEAIVQQHQQALATTQAQIQQYRTDLAELEPLLQQATAIVAGYQQLQQARQQLQRAEQRQAQAAPLLQQRQQVQEQLQQAQNRLQAHLEDLQSQRLTLQQQHRDRSEIEQALAQINDQIAQLEQWQQYREQVQQKQQERCNFLARLQARQRDYEAQLAELESQAGAIAPDSACPLCNQGLDLDHWQHLQSRYQQQQTEIQNLIWVICEQFAVSEREIQILSQEYRDRGVDLAPYAQALEERGRLQAQLVAQAEQSRQLQQLDQQVQTVERSLLAGDFAPDLQRRLRLLDRQLQELGYCDRDLQQAQQAVAQWHSIEERYVTLQAAQQQRQSWLAELTPLEIRQAELQQALQRLPESPQGQHLQQLQRQQQQVEAALRALAQPELDWDGRELVQRYQTLQQAEQERSRLRTEQAQLERQLSQQQQALEAIASQAPAMAADIQTLDSTIAHLQAETQALQDRLQAQVEVLTPQPGPRNAQQLALSQSLLASQRQTLNQERSQVQHLIQLCDRVPSALLDQWLPHLQRRSQAWLDRLSPESGQLHWRLGTTTDGDPTLDLQLHTEGRDRNINTCSGSEAKGLELVIRLAWLEVLAQRAPDQGLWLLLDMPLSDLPSDLIQNLIQAVPPSAQALIVSPNANQPAIAADHWLIEWHEGQSWGQRSRAAATGTAAD